MKRIFFLFLMSGALLFSENQNPLFEKPRTCHLLPGLLSPVAVEPAVPEAFVAGAPDGKPNITSVLFWGKEHVLKEFFKNPACLKEPILSVQVSLNLRQKGSKGFEGEKELLRQMKEHGFSVIRSRKLNWGNYPVWAVLLKSPQEEDVHIAWVGINSSEGAVLMFSPVFPKDEKKPDLSFWEIFLTKTKPLEGDALFRAHGLSLREGETLVQEGTAQMRVTAERRNWDHKLLVVVEPLSESTEFDLNEIKVGKMGGKWNKNRLIAKVEGQIVNCINGMKFVTNTHTTSVLIRDVEKFTPNFAQLQRNPRNKVYFQ